MRQQTSSRKGIWIVQWTRPWLLKPKPNVFCSWPYALSFFFFLWLRIAEIWYQIFGFLKVGQLVERHTFNEGCDRHCSGVNAPSIIQKEFPAFRVRLVVIFDTVCWYDFVIETKDAIHLFPVWVCSSTSRFHFATETLCCFWDAEKQERLV